MDRDTANESVIVGSMNWSNAAGKQNESANHTNKPAAKQQGRNRWSLWLHAAESKRLDDDDWRRIEQLLEDNKRKKDKEKERKAKDDKDLIEARIRLARAEGELEGERRASARMMELIIRLQGQHNAAAQ